MAGGFVPSWAPRVRLTPGRGGAQDAVWARPNSRATCRSSRFRPLRHACHGCGTCCHGWQVELEDAEVVAVLEQGRVLGVDDPVVDGVLRRQDGRCVFLDDALRCRIHATFGAIAEPRVCQLYPLRAVRAEDGLRVGVDPSCTSTLRTWQDGPEVAPLRTVEQVRQLDPALAAWSRAIRGRALWGPLIPVSTMAHWILTGDRP